ncbi:MAG TPA: uroporphyrinogen-III synthase [Gemmatimonadaceae bacterium]|nr:uroporphyrinogen-III synthase [Gemmatimonadaceae bacterium]
MTTLGGARVALFESRRSTELAALVRRHGGEPVSVPAVHETPLATDESAREVIAQLARREFNLVIFLTGVGAQRLFDEAASLGLRADLLRALEDAVTVCRGPKPVAALRAHGVRVSHAVPMPHTTAELVAVLEPLTGPETRAAIVHAGEPFPEPAAALRQRGAAVTELQLYEWTLPETSLATLQAFVRQALDGRIDCVAFTSQVQLRHLLQAASTIGAEPRLRAVLNTRVVVAAVGPTCATALRAAGITPHVVPDHPKMGQMVVALARYLDARTLTP